MVPSVRRAVGWSGEDSRRDGCSGFESWVPANTGVSGYHFPLWLER
jgi:hypothetical protein